MKGWIHKIIIKTCFILSLTVILVCGSQIAIVNGEGNEYYIKAMYVLNFMKYIEWPDESKEVYKIGVIGKSEIYEALLSMVSDRKESKKIIIEKMNVDSKESYEIIIVPKSESQRIEDLVKRFQNKGVLIISDECKNNGIAAINLLNIDNKIRFEINTNQAHIGGVKISSKLIELAVSVKP